SRVSRNAAVRPAAGEFDAVLARSPVHVGPVLVGRLLDPRRIGRSVPAWGGLCFLRVRVDEQRVDLHDTLLPVTNGRGPSPAVRAPRRGCTRLELSGPRRW